SQLATAFDVELDIVSATAGTPSTERVRVHAGLAHDSDELLRLYQQAHIFVLPTTADFSPLVIPEAMASGLPVVSATVGAIPEMVDEGSGVLVPPGDVPALAASVARLVTDTRGRKAM